MITGLNGHSAEEESKKLRMLRDEVPKVRHAGQPHRRWGPALTEGMKLPQ